MEEIIWWPRSHKKNEPQDQTQKVSTVIGTKKSDLTRWLYLALFFLSASSATAHTSLVANAVYEEARVSGQVTSHNSTLPLFQGMVDILSGCLPSDQYRLGGSRWQRTLMDSRECWLTSLIAAWHEWQPFLNWQLKPWRPLKSTCSLQCWHEEYTSVLQASGQ